MWMTKVLLGALLAMAMCPSSWATTDYILYDVFSKARPHQLKAVLKPFQTIFSYKTVGVERYYFLVVDDGSEALRNVSFPDQVSMNYQPMRRTKDYFRRFNVTSGWEEPSLPLPDKDLIVIKWEFIMPKGTPMASFNSQMQAWGEHYKDGMQAPGVDYDVGYTGDRMLSYTRQGYYPLRTVSFLNLSDKRSHTAILNGLDTVGGPARGKMYVKHCINI